MHISTSAITSSETFIRLYPSHIRQPPGIHYTYAYHRTSIYISSTPRSSPQTRSTNAGCGYRLSPTISKNPPRTTMIGVIYVSHGQLSQRASAIGVSRPKWSDVRYPTRQHSTCREKRGVHDSQRQRARSSMSCMKSKKLDLAKVPGDAYSVISSIHAFVC